MTITSRGPDVSNSSGDVPLPDSVTGAVGQGVLRSLELLLEALGAPLIEGLPPLHSGFVGYLGYDVVREIERLPDVAHDDLGLPDASLFLIGQLCAFDHWLQRVVLWRTCRSGLAQTVLSSTPPTTALQMRLDELASDLFRPVSQPALPGPAMPRRMAGCEAHDDAGDIRAGRSRRQGAHRRG